MSWILAGIKTAGENKKWFSGFRTKKEAEKAMAKKLHEINEGLYVEPSSQTFQEFLEKWLENKKDNLKPSTFDTYRRMVQVHIIPSLGKHKLDKLNPIHINDFYKHLREDKRLAPASIYKCHNVIRNALNQAVKYGFIARNAAEAVDTPKVGKKEMKFWNERQVMEFLEIAKDDRLYIVFFLAVTTGMRRGEILGLRWKDIDFKKGVLSINQTLSNDGKQFISAKTNSSQRSIALPDQTIQELKKQKKKIAKDKLFLGNSYNDHDLVVATSLGNSVHPRNVNRTWDRLLKKTNLPRIRFHDLRHTHATLMLKQGVHPKIVSERLGHSNVKITLDTYSHVLPGLQEAAAKQFGDMLFNDHQKNSGSS